MWVIVWKYMKNHNVAELKGEISKTQLGDLYCLAGTDYAETKWIYVLSMVHWTETQKWGHSCHVLMGHSPGQTEYRRVEQRSRLEILQNTYPSCPGITFFKIIKLLNNFFYLFKIKVPRIWKCIIVKSPMGWRGDWKGIKSISSSINASIY